MNRPPRILLLLSNPWVQGDATIAVLFVQQLRANPNSVGIPEIRAIAQPAAVPALRRAAIKTHALTPDPGANERQLRSVICKFRPDLVLLSELRNFLDQVTAEDDRDALDPFVANLRWASLRKLGPAVATFDNIPGDRFGAIARSIDLPMIVPVPPLDPMRLRHLTGRLHLWCSLPIPPDLPRLRPGRRLRVLLTLSEWSAQIALDRGLGLYYLTLERQLSAALARLDRPATLFVAGGPARYFAERSSGRVHIRPMGPVTPGRFERLLLGADILISDHALQLSLVRRLRAGQPALLLQQSLSYEDRDRPPFSMEPEARNLLEIWLRTRPDVFGPWDLFPLPREPGLLDREPYFLSLPKAELFDTGGIARSLSQLLDATAWPSARAGLDRVFARAAHEPTAPEIVNTLLEQA